MPRVLKPFPNRTFRATTESCAFYKPHSLQNCQRSFPQPESLSITRQSITRRCYFTRERMSRKKETAPHFFHPALSPHHPSLANSPKMGLIPRFPIPPTPPKTLPVGPIVFTIEPTGSSFLARVNTPAQPNSEPTLSRRNQGIRSSSAAEANSCPRTSLNATKRR